MIDSFYMDNNRLLGLTQTKIMVVHGSNSKKNRELPSEGIAISHKLTENWYMAPTVPVYLPNYCRSVWVFQSIDILFPTLIARGIAS